MHDGDIHADIGLTLLQAAGVSDAELRWLVAHGFLSRVVATGGNPPLGTGGRRDRRSADSPAPSRQPGVAVTEKGKKLVQSLLIVAPPDAASGSKPIPVWNAESRELSVGGLLIKRFRVPAEMQEIVCGTFEFLGWPRWIDDPLPRDWGINPKKRVHDTINNLNRNQLTGALHFSGDGSGQRFGWRWRDRRPGFLLHAS